MKKITLALIIAFAVIGMLAPLTFADSCGVTKTDVIKSIIGYMNQKSDITKEQVMLLINAYSGSISCSDALLAAAKQKVETIDNSIVPRCSDGTMYSHCSTIMPKYCYVGRIINRCDLCCETGRCISEDTCYIETGSNGIPPSISITSPANNQVFTTSAVTVKGTASDNVAIGNVTLRVNSGSWQAVTGTRTWTKNINLVTGKNTITAKAYDIAGNSKETSVTVTYNAPASGTNILKNPGFESGKSSWTFYTGATGTFTTPSPGYEGINASKITIGAANTNIQLYQYDIALEPNTKYKLSFAAYSSTGRDISVQLIKHVSPYTAYGLDYTADLNKTWNTYTKEFYTTGFTVNVTDARFRFWLAPFAAAGDIYYIDGVRLEKVPPSAPQSPLNLKATSGDTKVNLSWQAPSDNGGSAITNYRIYRSTSTGSETYLTEIGNTLTCLDTGLNNTQKYFYKISAKNQVGEGPLSAEANATPSIASNPYLVAHWKFDNNALDSTGNGHTATINGSAWTTGYLGSALKFDGINDYVSAQSIQFNTYPGLTVEAWVKTDSVTGTKTIFDYGVDTVHLHLSNGKPTVYIRNATSIIKTAKSATSLNKGSWYHVAGVYDKKKVYIYVNGTLKTSVSHSGSVRDDNTYGNRIGSSLVWPAMVWGTFFNGTIDDVKIYSKALNATEIYADYTSH